MLFADITLVRRIEAAERRLVVDMARSIVRRNDGADVFVAPLGAGAAVYAGDASPLNKIVGCEEALDGDALTDIEREFERRGAAVRVELASHFASSLGPLLTRRGYVLVSCENVLGLALGAGIASSAPAASTIAVERIDRSGARAWIDVVVTGFLHPDGSVVTGAHDTFARDALEHAFSDSIEVDGFDLYLARRDGQVAGGGGMRRSDGVAQLCGASTLPAHRRHGVQTALLRTRLADAERAGCDVAIVTTEPGSKSEGNARRRGFELLYTRTILLRSRS